MRSEGVSFPSEDEDFEFSQLKYGLWHASYRVPLGWSSEPVIEEKQDCF